MQTGTASAAGTTNGTLPDGIEIFKPGPAIDDAGVARHFSAEQLADMASVYDPALREAPLTVGHPAHDKPAYGLASALQVNADGRLVMNTRQVEAQFAEMVRAGRFPKRSSAFYPPEHPNNPKPGHWYLRHVAFLGAQPPAIAGLKDIAFADDATGLVCFSEAHPHPHAHTTNLEDDEAMSKELQDKLDAALARATAAETAAATARDAARAAEDQLAATAETQRKARHAAHVAFAEGALLQGKLKKPEVAEAVAVLDLLAVSETVQFSEGDKTRSVSPVEFVKARIAAAVPLVQFAEQAGGGAGGCGGGGAHGLSDAELHERARAYAAQHNVAYADALTRVVSFTG